HLDVEAGRTNPASLRHVHHDAVGTAVLHLDVAVTLAAVSHPERRVHVVARRGPGRAEPLGDRLQALDLEADVVDATPILSTLDTSDRVVLEVEDGEVDIAVTQVVASRARTVDPGDLLHPEHVDVELGGLLDVLGR